MDGVLTALRGRDRRRRAASALLVVTALVTVTLPAAAVAAPLTPQFVQVRANEVTSGTTNSLAFPSANTAGSLIVAYVVWNNTGSVSLSDSRGNAYASAVARTTWGASSNWSAQVFYAKNVAGGSNTVTATFATAITSFGIVYVHEYAASTRPTRWTSPRPPSAPARR